MKDVSAEDPTRPPPVQWRGVATPAQAIVGRACALPGCESVFPARKRGRSERLYCTPAHRFKHWDALHPRQRTLDLAPAPERVLLIGPTPADIRRAHKPATVLCLRMLQAGPCDTGDFIRAGVARYAARIHELRRVGHRIATRKLSDHAARYTLQVGGDD